MTRTEEDAAVRRHTPLVKYATGLYLRRRPWLAQHQEDLFQEGMIGLLRAIRTYRPGRGAKFSTYAVAVIQNQFQKAAGPLAALDQKRGLVAGDPSFRPRPNPTPEHVAIVKNLAEEFEGTVARLARGSPRDASIYLRRAAVDRNFRGNVIPSPSGEVSADGQVEIGRQHGISKQRVEQIEREFGAGVRAWGARVEGEA